MRIIVCFHNNLTENAQSALSPVLERFHEMEKQDIFVEDSEFGHILIFDFNSLLSHQYILAKEFFASLREAIDADEELSLKDIVKYTSFLRPFPPKSVNECMVTFNKQLVYEYHVTFQPRNGLDSNVMLFTVNAADLATCITAYGDFIKAHNLVTQR